MGDVANENSMKKVRKVMGARALRTLWAIGRIGVFTLWEIGNH